MPTRTYTIKFVDSTGPALVGVQKLTAALVAMDKAAIKAAKSLHGLGGHDAALQMLQGELAGTKKGLDGLATSATKAGTAVAGVGRARPGTALGAGVAAGVPGGRPTAGGLVEDVGIGAVAAKAVGLGVVGAGIATSTMGRATEEQRSFLGDAAEQAREYRRSLLGLAVLRDKKATGADEGLIGEMLEFSRQTLLPPAGATEFAQQFEGAVEAGKTRGNITPEVAKQFETGAGQFAARYDLDPKTAGKMAGLIPEYTRVPTAEAGVSKMAQIFEHLNLFGVGEPKEMVKPFTELEGTMLDEKGNKYRDPVAMAARFAQTTTRLTPELAVESIRRADRALNRFQDKKFGPVLKGLGITPEMTFEEKLARITPNLLGGMGEHWLTERGLAESEERRDLVMQATISETVAKNLADPRIAAAGATATATSAEFRGSETGRQMARDTATFAATVGQGLKSTAIQGLRQEARSQLIASGGLKETGVGSLIDAAYGAVFYGETGEQAKIDSQVMANIARRGKAVGIPDAAEEMRAVDWAGGTGSFLGMPGVGAKDEEAFRAAASRAESRVSAAEKLRQAGQLLIGAGQQMGREEAGGGGSAPVVDPKRR